MGHGKETPRQKMIGMMYLVLTALLALNVSKQVLDAFVLVDEGLTQTNENFAEKNRTLYDEMTRLYASNQVKVKPWMEKSDEIKKRANELVDFIQKTKVELVRTADKDEEATQNPNRLEGAKVQAKDNMDIPTNFMVGENNNGKGREIKERIIKFREFCNGLIAKEHTEIRNSVNKTLDTEAPPVGKDQVKHTWESEHFGELPLIAVTTIMSKMQGDVRNVESEMVRYLLSQVDAGAYKFNKLEAIVTTNSNYILRGNKYKAEVFISAQDSTQRPEVYVGNYRSVKKPDGSTTYEMVGNYQTLPIQPNGHGLFEQQGSVARGSIKWGGLVKIKSPEGAENFYPFEAEYQVAEANAVISPTKMNVFYLGVDNPVEISVPGVPADKIKAKITNGSIVPVKSGGYIVRPQNMGNAYVSVDAQIDNNWRNMGQMEFRVKRVPDPVAKVGGKKGGFIPKGELLVQSIVQADLENFDFQLTYNVTEFTVSANQGGFAQDIISKSNRITQAQQDLIRSLGKGQKVYFLDIKAVGPDGGVRDLSPIVFKIN